MARKRIISQYKNLQSHCAFHLCSLWPRHVFSSVACRAIPRPTSCIRPLVDRHLDSWLQTSLSLAQYTSSNWVRKIHKKNKMAAMSRTLWCSFQRPVVVFRRNLALSYRTNQLRLRSSQAKGDATRKGLFQSRGFLLLFGSGTAILALNAYHNRLWEARQRRRLRVSVEGIGRFFR